MQRGERLVHQLVDLDPLAQRFLATAERPLARYPDFVDPSLARRRFDLLDQLAYLLLEGVGLCQQIRLEDYEEISVILFRAKPRACHHPERLHDQSEAKSLIAAERQQRAASCRGGIARRMPIGIDGYPFG